MVAEKDLLIGLLSRLNELIFVKPVEQGLVQSKHYVGVYYNTGVVTEHFQKLSQQACEVSILQSLGEPR